MLDSRFKKFYSLLDVLVSVMESSHEYSVGFRVLMRAMFLALMSVSGRQFHLRGANISLSNLGSRLNIDRGVRRRNLHKFAVILMLERVKLIGLLRQESHLL